MLKILSLKAAGFRGFNGPTEIAFNDDLTVIYGPNGYGKTSVVEAVEWTFFGTTSRRDYARSKGELKDSYRNLHYPPKDVPFVELVVVHKETRVTLRRELIDDEKSRLLLDGKIVGNLESLSGISEATPSPVLAQHALTDFIHTEPVNRWNALSQLLGLEQLTAFRASLRSAITQLENEFEPLTELVDRTEKEAQAQGWSRLRAALRKRDVTGLETELPLVVQSLATSTEIGLPVLEARRQMVLGQSLQIPEAIKNVAVAMEATRQSLADRQATITKAIGDLSSLWPTFLGLVTSEATARELDFFRAGLDLAPEPPTCPFCGQDSLSAQRLDVLKTIMEQNAQLVRVRSEALRTLNTLSASIKAVVEEVKGLAAISPDQAGLLKELILRVDAGLTSKVTEFLSRASQIEAGIVSCSTGLKETIGQLSTLHRTGKNDPNVWRRLKELLQDLDDYCINATGLCGQARDIYSELSSSLAGKAEEDGQVRALGLAIRLVRDADALRRGIHAYQVIEEAKTILKDVESYERSLTEERLKDQEKDALDWCEVINPNEQVKFTGLEVGRSGKSRQVSLFAESYGRKAHAVAVLSESHLNALGLSVHLSRAVTPHSVLRFVILDDPVQSMDQAHSERVADMVIGRLLKKGWQVIVLSHLKSFASQCLKVRSMDEMEEISAYTSLGPKFETTAPGLRTYLENAEKFRDGNSESRTMAAQQLRKAVERFCKDVYRSTGSPVPRKFENKTVSELKALAVTSGKLTPPDLAKLDQIISLGDPASHDDGTVEPPTKEQLQYRISLLKGLMSTYLK